MITYWKITTRAAISKDALLMSSNLGDTSHLYWSSSVSNFRSILTVHYGSSFIVSHLLPGGIQISGSRKNMKYLIPNFFQKHNDQLGKPYLSAEAAMTDSQCQRRLWYSHSQIPRLQLSSTLASIVKRRSAERRKGMRAAASKMIWCSGNFELVN